VFFTAEEGLAIMARFLHSIESFTKRKGNCLILAFSWFLGLGAGGLALRYAGEHIVSMMPLAAVGQPSIVSLFLRISLPFLLCAAAAYFHKPMLVPAVCFVHAFVYGYGLSAVFAAFAGYGWLIRLLLLFTATFGSCLLYGYAGRYVSGFRQFSLRELLLCELLIAALALFDFYRVSPLLRQLLS
jgi:hypothetical protein